MSETRNSSLLGKFTVLVVICFCALSAVVVVICFCALSAQGKYGGGNGTSKDPYQIRDVNHMQAIGADSNDLDKHFKLMADIDLSGYTGTQFNIIGTNFFHPFTGVFNGNGHTISNFTYKSKERNIGLFVFVSGENAEIKNLGLLDPDIDSGARDFAGSLVGYLTRGTINNCFVEGGIVSGSGAVGGLVSTNERGTITNCYSTGSFAGTTTCVGGLVGFNWDGSITNCYSTGNVQGKNYVGGLVGENWKGTITNCSATGSVEGTTDDVGGLVGFNQDHGTITKSYSTGNVQGKDDVGGLVGRNWEATITNCYSTGKVQAKNFVGGLVGYNLYTITDCYSQGDVSGNTRVGGLLGKNTGTISNCYSTGSVSGNYRRVGGLVGTNGRVSGLVGTNEAGTISNCYATGSVSGKKEVGGLLGWNYSSGRVMHSFWDIETSGQSTSAGGTGLPTDQMQTMSTFTDAEWDFVGEKFNGIEDIWFIPEGDYPHLWWERK